MVRYNSVRLLRVIAVSRIFWPENFLPDSERFLIEGFSFCVFVLNLVKHSQIIETGDCVRMFRAKKLLPNLEYLAEPAVQLLHTRALPGKAQPDYSNC